MPFIFDTFTGTAGVNLKAHAPEIGVMAYWVSGSDTLLLTNENRLRCHGTASRCLYCTPAASRFHSCQADVVVKSLISGVGLVARSNSNFKSAYYADHDAESGVWTIRRLYETSEADLGNAMLAMEVGETYSVVLDCTVDGVIALRVDGVEVLSVTDAVPLNGRHVGVYGTSAVANDTGLHLDNFSASNLSDTGKVAIVVDGDSIMTSYGTTPAYADDQCPYHIAASLGAARLYNYAAAGQTVVQMASDAAAQVDATLAALTGMTPVLVIMGGINDVGGADDAATIAANIKAYCAARRAAGWGHIVGCTLLPTLSVTGAKEVKRRAVNDALRADTTFCDVFVDAALDERLLSYKDTRYIQNADGTHPTTQGRVVMGGIIASAIQGRISSLAQLATDQAAVIAAKADIRKDVSILGTTGSDRGTLDVETDNAAWLQTQIGYLKPSLRTADGKLKDSLLTPEGKLRQSVLLG